MSSSKDFRNRLGQLTGLTRYHDLTQTSGDKVGTTAYSYDGLNRLTAETTTRGTGTLTLAYNQTIASQIIALATADGTSNLTYDRDGQIDTVTTASGSGALPAEDFSFDDSGNRDSTGYTTGSDNQMASAPAISGNHYEYTYDHEGNTTASSRMLLGGVGTTA